MGHRGSCCDLCQRVFCLCFSSRSFIVSRLTFKSLVDFEFIFVCGVRLSFLRNLRTILHSSCTDQYSFQRCRNVLFSSYPLQNFLFVDFFMLAMFMGVRWHLIVVLILLTISMLSIFSSACWPSVCLLWRKASLGLLNSFGWIAFWLLSCVSCTQQYTNSVWWKSSPCETNRYWMCMYV